MSESDPATIRPRTPEEREAYIAGYAAALNDALGIGLQAANRWLREMAIEEDLIERGPPTNV